MSSRLTGIGTPARSDGTPTRPLRTAHRAGIGRDKFVQALREAAATGADAGCARQHQAAIVAFDGPRLESASPG